MEIDDKFFRSYELAARNAAVQFIEQSFNLDDVIWLHT